MAASLRRILPRASRRFSYWSASTGNIPQKTMGTDSLYPGNGGIGSRSSSSPFVFVSSSFFAAALYSLDSVMVSPTRASSTSLIDPHMYPTSPALRHSTGTWFGCMIPTSVTSCSALDARNLTLSPFFTAPSTTRKKTMTPRYASKSESKMSARNGPPVSGFGGGTYLTMDSRMSSMPMPALAEARTMFEQSNPMVSSISSVTRSGSAAGRSILFRMGMISRSFSSARYTFASVWASIPWLASTTSNAPSHAARLLLTS
mmetsp:Transcript_34567/g.73649  ORF Transcript_34567/g.73649 Transcript_34567/m.73649 type:complete len:259 (-) Transcript_34567:372-1148(-)